MIFLDSTRNTVALKEAYNKNIPTIAIVNAAKDMSQVCVSHRLACLAHPQRQLACLWLMHSCRALMLHCCMYATKV